MDVSNIQQRNNITIDDFILWAKSSDVGIQQSWKISLKDIVNLLNMAIGSGTVINEGQLQKNNILVGNGGEGVKTSNIELSQLQRLLEERITSVGSGLKIYTGLKDGVHSFRTIRGDTEKNILVSASGSDNDVVIELNKDCLRNLKLPYNAIPLGDDKGNLRFLEKGHNATALQTLDGVVQWAPLKLGEKNFGVNLGKGMPFYHSKSGEELRFKTLASASPEITLSESGGTISIEYKAPYKIVSKSEEIKVTQEGRELQLSFHTNPIKGFAELECSERPKKVPENKAHYTFLVNTDVTQDINSWVYYQYEGINDGAIVTFVNNGKKDMKFGVYTFVPHAYISFRWDAEGHSFNKI